MAKRISCTFLFVFCTWTAPVAAHAQKLYFGEKYEAVTHIGIHFAIGLWRPDYSVVAAISIETAQTISSGKFEADDLAYRLGGALAGYIIKNKYWKPKHKRDFWFTTAGSMFIGSVMYRGVGFKNKQTRITFDVARLIVGSALLVK